MEVLIPAASYNSLVYLPAVGLANWARKKKRGWLKLRRKEEGGDGAVIIYYLLFFLSAVTIS